MLGERVDSAEIGEAGIPGDRGWATRDEVRGGIRGAKKIAELMDCSARYPGEAVAGVLPAPEITLPGGEVLLASDGDASARLSEGIGHEVSLWPLLPADAVDHYRRGAPDDPDMEKELRAMFGRTPDEPLPDLGRFPPELFQFETPVGTYFDAYPLLVLSQASVDRMQQLTPDSILDVRRFRPNLVLADTGDAAFPENAWEGRRIRVGEAVLMLEMVCPRCVMTTHGFADLPKDPAIMRSLVREAGGNLGIYASVVEPGVVRTGDPIELLD
jgi:uncharacterized protein YcbX